jgi:hypothetical protein
VSPPAQPCAAHDAALGALATHPDPVVLAADRGKGEFAIANCGAANVDWAAAVNPKVTLATSGATLPPGESTTVSFVIDLDAYPNGAIDFKIKVTEPGHSHYVDVHAYNSLLGGESTAGAGLSAGAGVGGCSSQCITKARLRPNLTTPNVALDLATNTKAILRVYVSPNPPHQGPNGPVFPGLAPMATSPALTTSWTARLKPLQPSKTYHIIVTATDADGDRAHRHGSFRTVTPLTNPGGMLQPGPAPGCANQCLTSAVLTPGPSAKTKKLSVTSHTPALFQASVSTSAPTYSGGVPSFSSTVAWANSGLQLAKSWTTTLSGLHPDTKYHIIVTGEDAQGRRSYRAGQFRTPAAASVSVDFALVSVRIDRDGDKVGKGEVSLGWRVGDTTVATFGEKRRSDGDVVTFPTSPWSYVAAGVTEWLPVVRVAANERDPDAKAELCTMGQGVQAAMGSNASCDLKWNVASSGLVTVGGIASLPKCTAFPSGAAFPGYRCLQLSSKPNGDDYPSITALVAVRVT